MVVILIYQPKNGIGINFSHKMNTTMRLLTMHSLLASGASVAAKQRNEQKIAVFKVQMGFLATFQNKAIGSTAT